jgi:hypothetical protein
MAFNSGNNRFGGGQGHDAEPAALLRGAHITVGCSDQILSRAECNVGPGDDGAPQGVITFIVIDHGFHGTRGCTIERVAPMWAVDADHQQVIADTLCSNGIGPGGRGAGHFGLIRG